MGYSIQASSGDGGVGGGMAHAEEQASTQLGDEASLMEGESKQGQTLARPASRANKDQHSQQAARKISNLLLQNETPEILSSNAYGTTALMTKAIIEKKAEGIQGTSVDIGKGGGAREGNG
eukprot:CAMPEP_0174289746 /NCGR_PEP_ID=MMETSP0809-20121228/26159_1 /TAXON_ID=73025 ORGANISM="Eutreptiella gymnastica-like, Strain CCMP1594" /NCGR_SAMPLE_ID=MMETSP0809 /ASSEMBLY_ACC=CAM_ASM_000658 /LENGTH=120 /DNA_ID=CAMNT_0015387877 /DNA_START=1580 /DNA_END=1939 /DNA_ORIENTATION=+